MFDQIHKHIEPGYKKCFILYSHNKVNKNEPKVIRLSFVKFNNEEDFTERALSVAYTDYSKQRLIGRTFNSASLVIANEFPEGSFPVEKHFLSFINHMMKHFNYKAYPSTDLSENFYKKLKEITWPEEVGICEGDYTSLLHTILATKKALGKNILSVCFDHKFDDSFNKFFKYYHIDLTFNPEGAVLVTDKFITDERATEIVNMKPKVVISFNDACINSFGDSRAIGRLYQAGIHLVPSSITKVGNSLIAEGCVDQKRTMEQNFKLIETTGQRVETIWKFALEKRINFNEIVDEIAKAELTANRFKLTTYDVGVNLYKA